MGDHASLADASVVRCPDLTVEATVSFTETIEYVGKFVDAAGVAAIVLGIAVSAVLTLQDRESNADRYRLFRRRLGRAILLGLELLVAADIIRTVAVSPTFTSAGVLAIIVAIRTFLSVSLEVELEGRWPWSKETPRASLADELDRSPGSGT